MLQDLAALTGAAAWTIGSMLFFLAAFVAVVAWVVLRRPEEMDARARMPLDGESGGVRDTRDAQNPEPSTLNREP